MDHEGDRDPKMTVVGPDGEPAPAKHLTLGIERFNFPGERHFRLIWIRGSEAWLAEEDSRHFRRKYGKGGIVEAGQALAERFGAKYFSEITR